MRVSTLISGLLLVLTGMVLFLVNIGYGSWAMLDDLIKWWPLLLIILGLGMFGRGRLPYWIAYLIIILSLAAVGYYFIYLDKADHNNTFFESSLDLSRDRYSDVTPDHLTVDYAAGKLCIPLMPKINSREI